MNLRKLFTRRRICWFLVLAFVGINAAAFLFARQMLVFSETGYAKRGLTFSNALGIFLHGVAKPTNYRSPADHGLAFTTVVLRAAGQPDLEAWHVPHPNPRATVVLLHGYSTCKSQVVPFVPDFHKLGCEVWLLDFHGSGGSSGHTTSLGHHEAEDLARLVAELDTRATKRPLVLYGISMGGAAITRAIAELGVKPDGVVLVSTYNHMTDAVARRIRQTGVPDWPLAQLILYWGGVQRGMNPFKLRPADYARKITCPALVLHGALDLVVAPDAPKQIHANLAGPKKLITFDREGHGVHLDHEAEKWRTEISAWLDEVIAEAQP